jgi:hypothetical protein
MGDMKAKICFNCHYVFRNMRKEPCKHCKEMNCGEGEDNYKQSKKIIDENYCIDCNAKLQCERYSKLKGVR